MSDPAVLHDWARKLKARTDAGAIIIYDNDVIEKPEWRITEGEIAIRTGNTTFPLWQRGDDMTEAECDLRSRIRAYVPADEE